MTARFVFLAVETTSTRIHAAAMVPEDLACLEGHFDGFPVVPGAVQLDGLVIGLIRDSYRDLGALTRCSRIKFRRPLGPGDRISVTIVREPADSTNLTFDITRGGEPCSDGRLHFEEAA